MGRWFSRQCCGFTFTIVLIVCLTGALVAPWFFIYQENVPLPQAEKMNMTLKGSVLIVYSWTGVTQLESSFNHTFLPTTIAWNRLTSPHPLEIYRACLGLLFLAIIFTLVEGLAILMCLMVARTKQFKCAVTTIAIFLLACVTMAWFLFFVAFPAALDDEGTACPRQEYEIVDSVTGEVDRLWCSSFFGLELRDEIVNATNTNHNGTQTIPTTTSSRTPWSWGHKGPSFFWGPNVGWFCALASSLFAGLVLVLVVITKDKGSIIDNYEELKIFKKQKSYTDGTNESGNENENFFLAKLRELKGFKKERPRSSVSLVDVPPEATPTQVMASWFRKDL